MAILSFRKEQNKKMILKERILCYYKIKVAKTVNRLSPRSCNRIFFRFIKQENFRYKNARLSEYLEINIADSHKC